MTNHNELVKRLRDYYAMPDTIAAADALEAMAGERDEWEKAARNHMDRRERNLERAYAAEEERDRLKAALADVMEWIKNWEPPFTQDGEWAATELKARKALGGDA